MSNCWEYRDQDIYIPQDMRRELEAWHHRMEFQRTCRGIAFACMIVFMIGGAVLTWFILR